VWGKSFKSGELTLGHVIDPRTGAPEQNSILSAVALPSATETDALSTALLTLGSEGFEQFKRLRAEMRCLVVTKADPPLVGCSHGIQVHTSALPPRGPGR
jgi:thiamine biosynthesis lipoprotein ApbE